MFCLLVLIISIKRSYIWIWGRDCLILVGVKTSGKDISVILKEVKKINRMLVMIVEKMRMI